jgi:hypothetical protein
LPLDEFVRRLAALEQRLGAPRGPQGPQPSGGGPPRGQGGGSPPQPTPQRQPAPPEVASRTAEQRPREPRAVESARPEAPAEGRKEPPPRESPTREPPPSESPDRPLAPRDPPPRDPSLRRAAPAPALAATDPDFVIPDFIDQPEVEKKPIVRAAPPPPRAPQEEPKPQDLAAFRAILDRVNERRPELAAFLAHAAILEVTPGELKLGFEPGGMFSHGMNDKESLDLLTALASEHFGAPTKMAFEFESPRAKAIKTLATIDTEMREQKQRDAVAQAKKHRGITDAVEVLGARIKDLKLGPMTG